MKNCIYCDTPTTARYGKEKFVVCLKCQGQNAVFSKLKNQAEQIAELEAALKLALPSLLNLKAKVERGVGEPLPDDSRLLVAINTAEHLLSKVQS